jgi:hypothetical protein
MKKIIITTILLTLLIPVSSAQATTKFLNTKNNKNSCKIIKTNYKSEVMLDWAVGKANDNDMLKEIDENIIMLSKRVKLTSGSINTAVKSWIKAEKNTKTALQTKSVESVVQAMDLKFSSVTKFDQLCKSIKS